MPMMKQFNHEYVKEKQKNEGTQSLTRPQAEALNDAIIAKIEALPEEMFKDVGAAVDRMTEAGMYAFNPVQVDCPGCQTEVEPSEDDGECPKCGYDLTDELKELGRGPVLSEARNTLPIEGEAPNISEFKLVESGDERVIQILVDIENLKVACPEQWDVWNHLSGAQEILMGINSK